jgi:hypothetical protein
MHVVSSLISEWWMVVNSQEPMKMDFGILSLENK